MIGIFTDTFEEKNSKRLMATFDPSMRQLLKGCKVAARMVDGKRAVTVESSNPGKFQAALRKCEEIGCAAFHLGFDTLLFRTYRECDLKLPTRCAVGLALCHDPLFKHVLRTGKVSVGAKQGDRKLLLTSEAPELLSSLNGRILDVSVAARQHGFSSVILQSGDRVLTEITG